MTSNAKFKSDAFEAIYSTAQGLHRAGVMDKATMRDFDGVKHGVVDSLQLHAFVEDSAGCALQCLALFTSQVVHHPAHVHTGLAPWQKIRFGSTRGALAAPIQGHVGFQAEMGWGGAFMGYLNRRC